MENLQTGITEVQILLLNKIKLQQLLNNQHQLVHSNKFNQKKINLFNKKS